MPLRRGSAAIGELWLCGDQVARGYLNGRGDDDDDDEMRAFVDDAFGSGRRAYRTGDLVQPCGGERGELLAFVGRLDAQLKVRGVRVDGDEVATVLRRLLESVRRIELALDANAALIAFVDCRVDDERVLRATLAALLPAYAVPTRIIGVDEFPLSAQSGKLDRRALLARIPPMCCESRTSAAEGASGNSPIVERLKRIWRSLLSNAADEASLSADSHFFVLGGHSLLLIRLQSMLQREFGVDVAFEQLQRDCTLAAQTRRIERLLDSHSPSDSSIIETIRESPDDEGKKAAANFARYTIAVCSRRLLCSRDRRHFVCLLHACASLADLLQRLCDRLSSLVCAANNRRARRLLRAAGWRSKRATIVDASFQIFAHSTARSRRRLRPLPFLLLGHSLGGILSWEIAARLRQRAVGAASPLVVALDSWAIDNQQLDERQVCAYLEASSRQMHVASGFMQRF